MKIIYLFLLTFCLTGCTVHQYVIEQHPRHLRQHWMADTDRHSWNYKELTNPHVHDCYCNCEPKPRKARKVYYYDER